MADNREEILENLRFNNDDARNFGFTPMQDMEETLPFTDCIYAYLASMEYAGVAGILRKVGIPYKYGILLTGPRATGKHTAATAIVARLLSKSTYTNWFWLNEADFEDVEQDDAVEILSSVLSVCSKGNEPYLVKELPPFGRSVVLLEHLESVPYKDALFQTISDYLREGAENEYALPLIVLVSRENLDEYPVIKGNLMNYKFHLPNKAERNDFLNKRFVCVGEKNKISENELDKIRVNGITLNELVEQTEGYSYFDLKELESFAKLRAVYKATSEGIREEEGFVLSDHALNKTEITELLASPQVSAHNASVTYAVEQNAQPIDGALAMQLEKLANAISTMPSGGQEKSNEKRYSDNDIDALENLISDSSYDKSKRSVLDREY